MLASDALKSARIYLSDVNGITWSDSLLMPFLQEAFNEYLMESNNNRLPTLRLQTGVMSIPPMATSLVGQQPTNLLNPISMLEGDPGTDPDMFVDMIRTRFLPYTDPQNWLIYWSFNNETINFVGATQQRSVILRYEGTPAIPQLVTDALNIIFVERYLGPRIASMAYATIGRDNKAIQLIADKNLYTLIQARVVDNQTPTRRKAYRSWKPGTYLSAGIPAIVLPTTSATSPVVWTATLTIVDGIATQFAFPQLPKYVSYNGINQFVNAAPGYIIVANPNSVFITFIDSNGNTLTPNLGDTILGVFGVNQVSTTTPVNGVNTKFYFPAAPNYILWNSVNKFLNTNYKQTINSTFLISLQNGTSQIITPAAGSDIREAN